MAFHLYEDTWEISTTTGTGAYTLGGAVTGFRAFSAQYANLDTAHCSIYDGTNFEHGIYTYTSGSNSLARTLIFRSTNGNAAVNWGVGTRQVTVAPLGFMLESFLSGVVAGYPRVTAGPASGTPTVFAYDAPGQLLGTEPGTGNGNAGAIGEFVTANATGVALTNNTAANVASISLTAGDWDVTGSLQFVPAGSTTTSDTSLGITTVSATLPGYGTGVGNIRVDGWDNGSMGAAFPGPTIVGGPTRMSLSATTTVYLIGFSTFATSTMTVGGYIRARRMR